jgi:outer membrane PBP1 activator LpoA protein
MTAMRRWPFIIVAGLLLAGCATVPSGPSVMALPGSAKSASDFSADDAACRQLAASDAATTKKWRYDMTYLQCMYAKGNQIPSALYKNRRMMIHG